MAVLFFSTKGAGIAIGIGIGICIGGFAISLLIFVIMISNLDIIVA